MTFACPATEDFFRSRIDHMIDLRHPLAVQASRMPWQQIEASVAQLFSRKGRTGVAMPDLDLFGEQVQRVASPSNAGRPRVWQRMGRCAPRPARPGPDRSSAMNPTTPPAVRSAARSAARPQGWLRRLAGLGLLALAFGTAQAAALPAAPAAQRGQQLAPGQVPEGLSGAEWRGIQ